MYISGATNLKWQATVMKVNFIKKNQIRDMI